MLRCSATCIEIRSSFVNHKILQNEQDWTTCSYWANFEHTRCVGPGLFKHFKATCKVSSLNLIRSGFRKFWTCSLWTDSWAEVKAVQANRNFNPKSSKILRVACLESRGISIHLKAYEILETKGFSRGIFWKEQKSQWRVYEIPRTELLLAMITHTFTDHRPNRESTRYCLIFSRTYYVWMSFNHNLLNFSQ